MEPERGMNITKILNSIVRSKPRFLSEKARYILSSEEDAKSLSEALHTVRQKKEKSTSFVVSKKTRELIEALENH